MSTVYPFIALDQHDEPWIVLDSDGDALVAVSVTSGKAIRRIGYTGLRMTDMAHDDLLDQIVNRRQRLRMERPGSGTMGRAW